ncbi:snurportin-1 [Sabethes cyaneus]|uniref:snurportin-1 n=1 Tax=Sabethes cyaneus TaxID=53552 RepID=UPI00237D6B30|nr:snurportin-1 [Sabethes cyaneus]
MTDSDDSAGSRFSELYKNRTRTEQRQSDRRRELLEEQKRNRETEIDSARAGLLELIEAADPEEESTTQYRPRFWFSKLYRNKVQLSEWMYERPEDLSSWILVPCPVGRRCLLVIRRGIAVAYDKNGRSITKFTTRLGKKQRVTVLDCFLAKNHTFYAVDLLVYNEMDLVQCDCQLRFLWLRSKAEEDLLQEKIRSPKESSWRLEIAPMFDCAEHSQVTDCLSRHPMFPGENVKLDGLLFYHKESNYIYGKTPLVTWLYPFMVPDLLGESWRSAINHYYLQRTPSNYVSLGYRGYMDQFDAKLAKKLSRRSGSLGMAMEDEIANEENSNNFAINEQMDAVDESYEDEDWQRKELDEIRRLEMEG